MSNEESDTVRVHVISDSALIGWPEVVPDDFVFQRTKWGDNIEPVDVPRWLWHAYQSSKRAYRALKDEIEQMVQDGQPKDPA